MNRTLALSIVFAAVASSPALAGLTLQGSAGSSWRNFPGTLNNYSNSERAYWNQDTLDRAGETTNRNIGNYLNGTWTGSLPAGSAASPNVTPRWWGRPANPDFYASMDNNISFALTGGSTQAASTMRMELSGYSSQNSIGWYNLADAPGAETLNVIFAGAASPVTETTFSPSGAFGLFIRTGGGHIFFSQSARNRADGGAALTESDLATQHFAIFQRSAIEGAQSFFVGTEDLPRSSAGREIVGDYNDVIFTLSAVQVPTPGAAALFGLGGLAIARRRR